MSVSDFYTIFNHPSFCLGRFTHLKRGLGSCLLCFRVSPFVARYQYTLLCFWERYRSRKFLPLLSTHATPLDTDSPSEVLPRRLLCIGFRCVKNVTDCIDTLTMLTWLQGCAYPLWPMWFSVYASCILLCSRLPQSETAGNAPPDTQHSIWVAG